MDNLNSGNLTIETSESDDSIRLQWRGKSTERQPNKIVLPFIANVFAVALETHRSVDVHFEQLEHLNSATITTVIQIIQEAKTRGVRLRIVYDQGVKWQKLSFDALRDFAAPRQVEFQSV
jgi:hypothetical protein